MRLEGIDAWHASQFPEAREANELDEKFEWERIINAKSESFYNQHDGQKLDHFRNVQEMQEVIATREYRESPSYRAAVQRMAENSPCMMQAPERDTRGDGQGASAETIRTGMAQQMHAGHRHDRRLSVLPVTQCVRSSCMTR
jgi:hypothetical protein